MSSGLGRGLIAGAVGTLVLDTVTYLDMAVRGRPASEMPRETVTAALDAVGLELDLNDNQGTALGALAGMKVGAGVGAALGVARAHGVRLSPVTGAVVTGLVAMAATDGPATALGVTDPRTWSVQDWLSDVLPHLAYGAATHQVLVALDPGEATTRPSVGLLGRSLLLGVAAGSRSSLGLLGAASGRFKALSVVAVGGELVADKLPMAPSRLEPPGLASRFGSSAIGAIGLAAHENAAVDLPVLAAAAGAAVGAFAGAAWREAAIGRMPAWAAAVAEDVVALGLAGVAIR